MQYDEYLITGSNHGFMCRAPCGLMNDGRCDPPNPLANCIVPCALCYVHCAVCISCVHCATCIALSPYCWAYTALTFVIPVLRPLTMVLTNVNVVLSTELAREGCFFKFCGSLCTQRCNKQTSPGLLDMSDDFWMKCQEIVYPEGIPQAHYVAEHSKLRFIVSRPNQRFSQNCPGSTRRRQTVDYVAELPPQGCHPLSGADREEDYEPYPHGVRVYSLCGFRV